MRPAERHGAILQVARVAHAGAGAADDGAEGQRQGAGKARGAPQAAADEQSVGGAGEEAAKES